MKIISLNTWAGRAGQQKIIEFFLKNKDVDIFCLQEIMHDPKNNLGEQKENIKSKLYNLLTLIKEVLPDHNYYFRPHLKEHYGLAIFIKKEIEILEEGEKFVFKEKGYIPVKELGYHARNIQYIKIKKDSKDLYVINFHGLWNGKGKTDTEERLEQSSKIIEFVKDIKDEMIICGDFNLLPDTKSIKMFEDIGLNNLIKEKGILSTRTSYYEKDVKFADYAFVTKTIKVKEFKVLPDEVSDHAPLFLEII